MANQRTDNTVSDTKHPAARVLCRVCVKKRPVTGKMCARGTFRHGHREAGSP